MSYGNGLGGSFLLVMELNMRNSQGIIMVINISISLKKN
jgi:hypothetical protein